MRTSHAQVLVKGFQHKEEDSKIKFCHKKNTSPVKNSRQLKYYFYSACMKAECAQGSQLQCFN